MKKIIFLVPLLLLSACATPDQTAPEQVGEFPPDYVVSAERIVDTENAEGESASADATDVVDGESVPTEEDMACQEKNAELSLQIDALTKQLATCETALAEKPKEKTASSGMPGITPEHIALIRDAILQKEQKEYPFTTCGQMGNFIRQSWFTSFSNALADAKIRFSNGFLETGDLFGGCQSTAGKMAFFLGAERNDDLRFIILKFRTDTKKLEPALMFDGAEDAAVTSLGKREGPYIAMPADDGRVFHYYYDANVVVEAQ